MKNSLRFVVPFILFVLILPSCRGRRQSPPQNLITLTVQEDLSQLSLLVLSSDSTGLAVIDPTTGQIQLGIPLANGSSSLAMTPDERTLFIANPSTQSIAVVDLSSLSLLETAPVGKAVSSVLFSSDLLYLATTNRDKSLSVLDWTSRKVVATLSAGEVRRSILPPNGRTLYLLVPGKNRSLIYTLDFSSPKLVKRYESAKLSDFALTPYGERLLLLEGDSLKTYVPLDFSLVSSLKLKARGDQLYTTPAGNKLYVLSREAKTLTIVKRSTNQILKELPVDERANHLVFSPDGARLVIDNSRSGSLTVVDAALDSILGTCEVPYAPADIAISPHGTFAFLLSRDHKRVDLIALASCTLLKTFNFTSKPQALFVLGKRLSLPVTPTVPPESAKVDSTPGDTTKPKVDTTAVMPDTAAGVFYTVQLSSSADPRWAEDMAQKLAQRGYSTAYTDSVVLSDGKTWHRVRLGTFKSMKDAEKVAQRLRETERLEAWVVRK
jgi:DNA-binding beta-propeller fold protein YncE